MSSTVTEAASLDKTDRCDTGRCGAEAFVQVTMPSGFALLFCGHHFRGAEDGLKAKGGTVTIDQREKINTKPSISANAV